MFKNILVATDGSELSERAMRTAVELVKGTKAQLSVVTCTLPFDLVVVEPWCSPRHDDYEAAMQNMAMDRLESCRKIAAESGITARVAHVQAEQAYQGILDTARSNGCDLVVMASRGRKRVSGLFLGSQTLKLLTHAPCCVLVCAGGLVPAYRHLLIATNGSEFSERAVRIGIDVAAAQRARVTTITCSDPFPIVLDDSPLSQERATYESIAENTARRRLDFAEAYAADRNVPIQGEHFFTRHPHEAIVDAAEKLACDTIVMASHGRRSTASFALGSETAKVLAKANRPVLVCR